MSRVKATGDVKKFDFIHMIHVLPHHFHLICSCYLMSYLSSYLSSFFHTIYHQMVYYVDDLADTISFYHSLLKEDGRLLILLAAGSFPVLQTPSN